MTLKQLFDDDDAVSPVIGVILMVAITVILAAVIGTFVLGLGNQVGNSAPTASLTVSDAGNDYNGTVDTANGFYGPDQNVFTISHDNGDSLNEENIRITVRYAENNTIVGDFNPVSSNITDDTNAPEIEMMWKHNGNNLTAESDIGVGDSLTLWDNSTAPSETPGADGAPVPDFSDDTDYVVTVIHTPSDSQLAKRTVELT